MTSQGGLPERPAGPAGPRLAKGIPLSTAIVIVALSALVAGAAVVAVEAEGRPTDVGQPRRVKGVVRLGGAQGFELLRWLDRDTALPQG